jgi:hypothetical protein
LVAGLLALSLAPAALATTQTLTFNYSAEIVGGENPGFIANATAIFSFDDECVGTNPGFCELDITLRYNPTTGTPSQGEALTGLLFEPLGSSDFRDGPPGIGPFGGVVGAEALVGNGNVIAGNELGTIVNTSLIDVSPHWASIPRSRSPASTVATFLAPSATSSARSE